MIDFQSLLNSSIRNYPNASFRNFELEDFIQSNRILSSKLLASLPLTSYEASSHSEETAVTQRKDGKAEDQSTNYEVRWLVIFTKKPPDQPFLRLCQSGAKPTTDKREPLNLLEPTLGKQTTARVNTSGTTHQLGVARVNTLPWENLLIHYLGAARRRRIIIDSA